ncbi:MAG: hypothetical protein KF687_14260 [Cyclobacteriaceae bacterium]|nr:hypothetical protein [Cyclobacteriaceae bacterium]
MKKRLVISLSITIGLLLVLLIPTFELIDWGFLESIAMLIHWPLFGAAFFGDNSGGTITFLIFWYGAIIALGTWIAYYTIQIITNKD